MKNKRIKKGGVRYTTRRILYSIRGARGKKKDNGNKKKKERGNRKRGSNL